ncbi:hypothetical protein [Kutzneria sp. CA-103260]|uniref:hypothetical protein n=1 Tax=Kutzneria sp. CA-103260 TaxID=2802641 RepID=UPI001BA8D2E3|nr:hypothetical protein [Kutzneria sp. CA-103260]QUQ68419.1 hypothetical protein JJ691_61640 [Kutzneria sp. CA-103260]
MRHARTVVVVGAAAMLLTACTGSTPVADPVRTTPSTTTAGSTTAASSTTTSPPSSTATTSSTPAGSPSTPPAGRSGAGRCPAYPNPSCTGVPPGTKLKDLAPNVPDGDGYRVTDNGAVLDSVHIAGNLLITAYNVTVRNSQIDGWVDDQYGNGYYSFTILDSTVGKPTGCDSLPGVGQGSFTARGVLVQNHSHGFQAGGSDVNVHDSYARICSNPGDHSDGIQSYGAGNNIVLDHNTLDERGVKDITAPVFLTDQQNNVTVTNNLLAGGTYSIQVKKFGGTAVVTGNRMVDKSWEYAPVESTCSQIRWSDNTIVTIDANYAITSTVAPLPCAS